MLHHRKTVGPNYPHLACSKINSRKLNKRFNRVKHWQKSIRGKAWLDFSLQLQIGSCLNNEPFFCHKFVHQKIEHYKDCTSFLLKVLSCKLTRRRIHIKTPLKNWNSLKYTRPWFKKKRAKFSKLEQIDLEPVFFLHWVLCKAVIAFVWKFLSF